MTDQLTQQPPRGHHGIDLMEQPAVGLVYLFFVFLPLIFQPRVPMATVLISLVACVLFLPPYRGRVGAWRLGPNSRWLVAALIGLLLLPVNPGGNTFLIYSAGLAGHLLEPRRAVIVGVGLAITTIAAYLGLYGTEPWAIGFVLIALVIGGMVLGGSLFGRLQARRLAELQLSQDEVRRLASHAERERIARDLHDLLGHTLSLVVLKSELAGKLLPRDPQAAQAQIGEVEQIARQALGEVRDAVSGYRRGDFAGELAATRLALISAGIEVEASSDTPLRNPEVDHALALCLREASTNVMRHARADRVSVDLSVQEATLLLTVIDDGTGGIDREGNGLRGIRERLEAFGGELRVESRPGTGTTLRLAIPEHWRASGAGA